MGSTFAIFIFVFFFSGGQLLNERICSFKSKFFLLKVDLFLEKPQTGSLGSEFVAETKGVYTYILM